MTLRSLSVLLLGVIVALGTGISPASIASAAEVGPGEGLVVFNRKTTDRATVVRVHDQPAFGTRQP